MRRVQKWQQEKARTAKALRERQPCAWKPGCTGKANGWLIRPLGNGDVEWTLACVACASEAQRARRERT